MNLELRGIKQGANILVWNYYIQNFSSIDQPQAEKPIIEKMKSAILNWLFIPLSTFKMQFKMDQPVATVCHNGPFENLFRVVILIGCRPLYNLFEQQLY